METSCFLTRYLLANCFLFTHPTDTEQRFYFLLSYLSGQLSNFKCNIHCPFGSVFAFPTNAWGKCLAFELLNVFVCLLLCAGQTEQWRFGAFPPKMSNGEWTERWCKVEQRIYTLWVHQHEQSPSLRSETGANGHSLMKCMKIRYKNNL